MRKNNIIICLVIVALLSGCVEKSAVSGTYTNTYKEHPSFTKELVQEFTFYDDGTWIYQSPTGSNSGVYQIHGKDIVITGQLVAARFTIQENGYLIDTSNNHTWKKKS